jgi:hypothetical protein
MKIIPVPWKNNITVLIQVPTEATEDSLSLKDKVILYLAGYDENGNLLQKEK